MATVVVAEERKGGQGYTRSLWMDWRWGCRKEIRSSSIRPALSPTLLWLPAPWLCESWVFGWQHSAVRAKGAGERGTEPGVRDKMPILLFLIDTSASMNQRTDLGTSYLDIAKGAVELFLKVKWGDGRAGESSRGMGVVVNLGDSVTFLSPLLPPSLRGPLCHPSSRSCVPGTRPAAETGICWSPTTNHRTA